MEQERSKEQRPRADARAPRAIPCPLCGVAMRLGVASIHGSLQELLSIDMPDQSLWFETDGTNPEVRAMRSGGECAAQRCERCGSVLLLRPPR